MRLIAPKLPPLQRSLRKSTSVSRFITGLQTRMPARNELTESQWISQFMLVLISLHVNCASKVNKHLQKRRFHMHTKCAAHRSVHLKRAALNCWAFSKLVRKPQLGKTPAIRTDSSGLLSQPLCTYQYRLRFHETRAAPERCGQILNKVEQEFLMQKQLDLR